MLSAYRKHNKQNYKKPQANEQKQTNKTKSIFHNFFLPRHKLKYKPTIQENLTQGNII